MTRRVESIRQPTVRGGRCLVVLDDGTRLRLEPAVAAQYGLAAGLELDGGQLARLKADNDRASAKARAVRILSATSVSRRELQHRLEARGASNADAEAAVTWLTELNLLDDGETARQLAAAAARKGYGARRIRQILYQKGIDRSLWDQAMEGLPAPEQALDRFLDARFRGSVPDGRDVQRAAEAMQRRGHSWNDIRAALGRYAERCGAGLDDCLECMEDDDNG